MEPDNPYRYHNNQAEEWCAKHRVWVPLGMLCEFCVRNLPAAIEKENGNDGMALR